MKNQTEKGIVTLKFTLDRFEESKAVLIGDDGEEIVLKKRMIPKEAGEGESLILTIATDMADTRRREAKAREILTELLNLKDDSKVI